MYINHERGFAFVHVPRTGGFSAYKIFRYKEKRTHTTRKEMNIGNRYFSFGFLRNPWDRMFSLYRKHRDTYKTKKHNNQIYARSGFKYWLLEELEQSHKYADRVNNEGMFWLDGCSYIAKYEDFNNEWKKIFDTIGMKQVELPHLHSSQPEPYQPQYDNEMIEYIQNNHTRDIKHFGYTFE